MERGVVTKTIWPF